MDPATEVDLRTEFECNGFWGREIASSTEKTVAGPKIGNPNDRNSKKMPVDQKCQNGTAIHFRFGCSS